MSADLIAKIQAGDSQAWADFLEIYSDLVYTRAYQYSQTGYEYQNEEDIEDEVANLYLFMADRLKKSLKSFRGDCQPKTWVQQIINKKQTLKAYLIQKDSSRADIRLPKVMQSRSEIDQKIYQRLVWGQDFASIALDLQISEAAWLEIEHLIRTHSPRVYKRILANRIAAKPELSLDAEIDADEKSSQIQPIDPRPNPVEELEEKERSQEEDILQKQILHELSESIKDLTAQERRILILFYNYNQSASKIVKRAYADENLGLAGIKKVDQVYYQKDKALDQILDRIVGSIDTADQPTAEKNKKAILKQLEQVMRTSGILAQRALENEQGVQNDR